ncbi:MAG TPA: HAMP domain-containing histidine kinase [Candidatus Caccomorpha excrementavium]|nr:HAMP domain-containing histidine kinase [Candidatus Caccomorpha excrementavium]
MVRNRELVRFLLFGIGIAAAGAAAGYFLPEYAYLVCLLFCLAEIAVFTGYTMRRYRQMEKLSDYLKRIGRGDYSLDIRDNVEGELSILKNEIYKVTTRLREQAEYNVREKYYLADALSDISHQLKTPLTSMMVMTDLLKEEGLPPDKREEFTDTIRAQLIRIEWLVTSLLKLSRLDAGTIVLESRPVSAAEVIGRAAQHLLIPMELKGIEFEVQGEENVTFPGDLSWSAEAFANILKNCMEHTPPGGRIRVMYEENHLYTVISVEDNGEGIAAEDLPHIFERFYKGKNAGADSVGIGLAMAYEIFAKEQGKIDVTSKEGEGTRFRVKFYTNEK